MLNINMDNNKYPQTGVQTEFSQHCIMVGNKIATLQSHVTTLLNPEQGNSNI